MTVRFLRYFSSVFAGWRVTGSHEWRVLELSGCYISTDMGHPGPPVHVLLASCPRTQLEQTISSNQGPHLSYTDTIYTDTV
jgi:hypothetical protein